MGLIWFIVGAILLIVSSVMQLPNVQTSLPLALNLLNAVINPAGFFTIWTGLDLILFGLKDSKPDLVFFIKMVKIQSVLFEPYVETIKDVHLLSKEQVIRKYEQRELSVH